MTGTRLLRHAFVLAGLAALLLAAPAAAAPAPRILVTTSAEIEAFAQDGGHIAWVSGCRVWVRRLSTGAFSFFGLRERGRPLCLDPWWLALGGTRAVWGGWERTDKTDGVVATGALGGGTRVLVELEQVGAHWGDFLTGVAGDRGTVAYSLAYVGREQGPNCLFYEVSAGDVVRVTNASQSPVPGARPSVAIAASAGRVAFVPAQQAEDDDCAEPPPPPQPGRVVEVRNAWTGRFVSRFQPNGTIRAVALSGGIAAVLVEYAASKRIERYEAESGRFLASSWVWETVADELDMAGRRIVYRNRRDIRVLDGVTGRRSLVATARETPVGLSIEGRRVAWAENWGGRGVVRAVVVGR